MGSGGGYRAMCGLSGVFCALEETGIVDCATYVTGLSGSSWYVAFCRLYICSVFIQISWIYILPWYFSCLSNSLPQLRSNIRVLVSNLTSDCTWGKSVNTAENSGFLRVLRFPPTGMIGSLTTSCNWPLKTLAGVSWITDIYYMAELVFRSCYTLIGERSEKNVCFGGKISELI